MPSDALHKLPGLGGYGMPNFDDPEPNVTSILEHDTLHLVPVNHVAPTIDRFIWQMTCTGELYQPNVDDPDVYAPAPTDIDME
jgi:hypothetical protein